MVLRRWFYILMVLLLAGIAPAAPLKKKFTPMPVFITERSGVTRTGQLMAQNAFEPRESNPSLHFDTETGTSEILVDNLVSITDIRETKGKKPSALFTFKDATQKRMEFGFTQECLWLLNEDGTKDKLDLRKIKSLEVLGRPNR